MKEKWLELLEKAPTSWPEEFGLLTVEEVGEVIGNLEAVVQRATFLARYLDLRNGALPGHAGAGHAQAVKRANAAKDKARVALGFYPHSGLGFNI